jgi:hypothetical protein
MAEELFEIGEREQLGLGQFCETDRSPRTRIRAASLLSGGQFDHRHDGISPAGRETHGLAPLIGVYAYTGIPDRRGKHERLSLIPL